MGIRQQKDQVLEARELTQTLTRIGEAYLLSPPGPLRLWTEWADAGQAPADWPYREELTRWAPIPPRALDLGGACVWGMIARAEQAAARQSAGAAASVPRPTPTMLPAQSPREVPPARRKRRISTPDPGPVFSFLDPAGPPPAQVSASRRGAANQQGAAASRSESDRHDEPDGRATEPGPP
jgi:hypothetical protein